MQKQKKVQGVGGMTNWRKYDDLQPGQIFPDEPAMFAVDESTIRAFRVICADTLIDAAPADTPSDVAPPMLAAVYIRPAQNQLRGPPGGVHAKQSFQFRYPVRAGDVLATRLEIIEKYERKGRRYLVSETRTTNQEGTLVTVGRIVSIWGNENA